MREKEKEVRAKWLVKVKKGDVCFTMPFAADEFDKMITASGRASSAGYEVKTLRMKD